MTVKKIVKEYLEKNGYDGLCYDECGCGIDDLICCLSNSDRCRPAYKHTIEECRECEEIELCSIYEHEEITVYCSKPRDKAV